MIDVVIPTVGRASLPALLASVASARGPRPQRIIIVDDRRERSAPLDLGAPDDDLAARITLLTGGAAGPAAARNAGWRASRAPWVAFLDDDVLVSDSWLEDLANDLRDLPAGVAGSQAHITVPLPAGRRPTDWERNVACLATAQWITADCAYRRADLLAAGGFDARFSRAYREDADLALRLVERGKRIVRGSRRSTHPVRPERWNVSLRMQAGNADDVLMDALHGRGWRRRASSPPGAFREHCITVAAALVALVAFAARKRRAGAAASAVCTLAVARFAWRRIARGPRTRDEVVAMALTSVALPFVAVAHRVRGALRLRALLNDAERAPKPVAPAVLFDRDGTLVVDVPHNADPDRVEPMPGARVALERLRAAGVATAVVTSQSGVALGRLTRDDVDAVNARVDALLGPLGPVLVCAHAADDRCRCRKPAPGLIEDAARALGVAPGECVVIGDVGADVDAARAAGARAILVPTPVTRAEEVAAAPLVAADLAAAVALLLGPSPPHGAR